MSSSIDETVRSELMTIVNGLRLDHTKRHILLCIGGKCSQKKDYDDVWAWLKDRCKMADAKQVGIARTNVKCLRICKHGPIALVYPEGTWYAQVDKVRCEEIFDSHLLNGIPVNRYAFASTPLT